MASSLVMTTGRRFGFLARTASMTSGLRSFSSTSLYRNNKAQRAWFWVDNAESRGHSRVYPGCAIATFRSERARWLHCWGADARTPLCSPVFYARGLTNGWQTIPKRELLVQDAHPFEKGKTHLAVCNFADTPLEARWDNLRIWDISDL
jgi:hypothetical protein